MPLLPSIPGAPGQKKQRKPRAEWQSGSVGKKSKTKNPECSAAMSAWGRARAAGMQVASGVFAILGKCRSMARQQSRVSSLKGNDDLKAQALQHRIDKQGLGGYLTRKDRTARARELLGQRATRNATRAAAVAQPAIPAKAARPGRLERAARIESRAAQYAKGHRDEASTAYDKAAALEKRAYNATASSKNLTTREWQAKQEKSAALKEKAAQARQVEGRHQGRATRLLTLAGRVKTLTAVAQPAIAARPSPAGMVDAFRGARKGAAAGMRTRPVKPARPEVLGGRPALAAKIRAERALGTRMASDRTSVPELRKSAEGWRNQVTEPGNARQANRGRASAFDRRARSLEARRAEIRAKQQAKIATAERRDAAYKALKEAPASEARAGAMAAQKAGAVRGMVDAFKSRLKSTGHGQAIARALAKKAAPAGHATIGHKPGETFSLLQRSASGSKGATNLGRGRTPFMFDMKKGDLKGQTSIFDKVGTVPTHGEAIAKALEKREGGGGNPYAEGGRLGHHPIKAQIWEEARRRRGVPGSAEGLNLHAAKDAGRYVTRSTDALAHEMAKEGGLHLHGRDRFGHLLYGSEKPSKPGAAMSGQIKGASHRGLVNAKEGKHKLERKAAVADMDSPKVKEVLGYFDKNGNNLRGGDVIRAALKDATPGQMKALREHIDRQTPANRGRWNRWLGGELAGEHRARANAAGKKSPELLAALRKRKAPFTEGSAAHELVARKRTTEAQTEALGRKLGELSHKHDRAKARVRELIDTNKGGDKALEKAQAARDKSEAALGKARDDYHKGRTRPKAPAKPPRGGKQIAKLQGNATEAGITALTPVKQTPRQALAAQRSKTAGRVKTFRKSEIDAKERATPEGFARHAKAGDVGHIPIEHLTPDPKRFQYKDEGVSSKGVTDQFKDVKVWNPHLGGTIQGWRDPADGKVYVVNGHHRRDLAEKLGVKHLKVELLDAPDAATARAIGAIQNIGEGRGTVRDAATFLHENHIRSKSELEKHGLSLSESVTHKGISLASLEPGLYKQYKHGILPEERGAIIGGSGLDHAQQVALMKSVKPNTSNSKLREHIDNATAAPKATEKIHTLFGTDENEVSLAHHRVDVQDHIKRGLMGDEKLFKLVSKGKAADALAERGRSHIDTDATKQVGQEAAAVLGAFHSLKNRSGPVARALNHASERLHAGEPRDRVMRDAREEVRKEVARMLRGGKESFAD
jgi:hypothetical protein